MDDAQIVDITEARRARDGFARTLTHDRVAGTLAYSLQQHRNALIVGPPGCGKTTAARRFVDEHERGAAIATMGARTRGRNPTAAMAVIAEALGGGTSGYRLSAVELHAMVRERIRHGAPRKQRYPFEPDYAQPAPFELLIIDEAHHLEQDVADALPDGQARQDRAPAKRDPRGTRP